jgi:hypothetical protein
MPLFRFRSTIWCTNKLPRGLSCRNKAGGQFLYTTWIIVFTQGATYKNAVEEFRNELGYLALPVMAKIYLNKSVSLELGPQASFC